MLVEQEFKIAEADANKTANFVRRYVKGLMEQGWSMEDAIVDAVRKSVKERYSFVEPYAVDLTKIK